MDVLILEASTSAAKAMVYRAGQGVLAEESCPFTAAESHGGTQNADAVLHKVLQAGRQAAQGHDIAAISTGSTWHSILMLDGAMKPVSPTYTWEYMETAPLCREMRRDAALTKNLYQRTGCVPHSTYMRQVLLYLKQQGAALAGRYFASQGAYLFHHLTGAFRESLCLASGSGLVNLHSGEYDDFVLEMLGIDPGQLGALTSYRQPLPLGEEGARGLGLPAGIPVVPAHPDGALNQVGNGAAGGVMTLSVGTSAALRMAADRPVLPDKRQTWCYAGVEGYLAGAATAGACNCVDWLHETVLEKKWSFRQLEAPTGAPLPTFLPFLYGERCPGWQDARPCGFMDLRPQHGAREMFQGVLQGVLFSVRQCYEALCAITGPPEKIILSGGILNSPLWCQMAADILERPVVRSAVAQASMLGGAALALHAAGALPDVKDFHGGDESAPLLPDAENSARCRESYAQYLDWYARTSEENTHPIL